MASMFVNSPCNVRTVKPLDCQNVGLKPSRNQDLVCVRPAINPRPRRLLIVRASEMQGDQVKKMGLSDAECEAAVVAGNVPEAPPVPPEAATPAGTPVVPSLVSNLLVMHAAFLKP